MDKCQQYGCDNDAYGVSGFCSDECLEACNKEQRDAQIASNYEKGCFQWGTSVKGLDEYMRGVQEKAKELFEERGWPQRNKAESRQ